VAHDLVIRGGALVSTSGIGPATLAVDGGRVTAVLPPNERPAAAVEIDASGLHILPGVIDTHVHTRHPGEPGREDALSGSSAAAAGGITTFVEMPISKVPTNARAAVEARAEAIEAEAVVDFALYGGAGHENLDTIVEQAGAGVVAYKTFLQPPAAARADEFVGLWCTDTAMLREVMARVAATGRRHCFHCEDWPLVAGLERRFRAAGDVVGRAHARSRPVVAEEISVATVIALARETGGPVQIVHLSSPAAAELVKAARARGVDVTAETCPPYLFLDEDALDRLGPFAKCNPPLRTLAEREALWTYVADGTIDVIGTDHSPFLEDEKARGRTNIFDAPPGLGGLEVLVPLMLTAVHASRLPLTRLPALLAERPAERFHLASKGRIAKGFDADLTLVDFAARWTFDAGRCLTRSRANMQAFDGQAMQGRVVSTFVRGVRVAHEGAIAVDPGHGRMVRAGQAPPATRAASAGSA
jgi:allantoinase